MQCRDGVSVVVVKTAHSRTGEEFLHQSPPEELGRAEPSDLGTRIATAPWTAPALERIQELRQDDVVDGAQQPDNDY